MVERQIREESDQVVEKKRNNSGNDSHETAQQRNVAETESGQSLAAFGGRTRLRNGIQSFAYLYCDFTPRPCASRRYSAMDSTGSLGVHDSVLEFLAARVERITAVSERTRAGAAVRSSEIRCLASLFRETGTYRW